VSAESAVSAAPDADSPVIDVTRLRAALA